MSVRNGIFNNIITAVLEGESEQVIALIEWGLKKGISAEAILEVALIPAANKFSEKYKGTDFFIPDVLFITHAISAGFYTLENSGIITNSFNKEKIVLLGTVEGDIHDIGKNIVSLFLQFKGFSVIDLGINIKPHQFAEAIEQHKPHILALSALLTTTLGEMTRVVKYLEKNHLRNSVKIIVGGGPVTKDFADSIGADGFAPNAQQAVQLALKLVK